MESDRFDALARALSTTDSRRRTLRALGGTLLGGVLGGVAATLGLGEDAEAKGKKHGKRHDDRKKSGQLNAAGKKHKKHKHKDKDKNKDKPEKPRKCSPGFRPCSGGTCIADVPGVCCIDENICSGGGCGKYPNCCPGHRQCYGTTTCVGPNECCPAEKKCADGCHPKDGPCCPEEKPCGGSCVASDKCCDDLRPLCNECQEAVCNNGSWECDTVCQDDCCEGQCIALCNNGCVREDGCSSCTTAPSGKVYCAGNNTCVPECPTGKELDTTTCQCKTKAVCPAGIACPGVRENTLPDGHGGFLPAGCCPQEHYRAPCFIGSSSTCCTVLDSNGHSWLSAYCSY